MRKQKWSDGNSFNVPVAPTAHTLTNTSGSETCILPYKPNGSAAFVVNEVRGATVSYDSSEKKP